MSSTLNRSLQRGDITSDVRALMLTEFNMFLDRTYEGNFPFLTQVQPVRDLARGTGIQRFLAIGRADWHEHDPGSLISSQAKPLIEDLNIEPDEKQTTSAEREPEIDWLLDPQAGAKREKKAKALNLALMRKTEMRALTTVIKGARRGSRYPTTAVTDGELDFPGGTHIRADGASFDALFPATVKGSKDLQHEFSKAALALDNKRLPEDQRRVMIVKPNAWNVLMKDTALSSTQVIGADGSYLAYRLTSEISGWEVLKATNVFPNTNVTTGEANYRLDSTPTWGIGVAHNEAVGIMSWGGKRSLGPVFDEEKDTWFYGVAELQGMGHLSPEACVEMYAASADHVLNTTTNYYEPA